MASPLRRPGRAVRSDRTAEFEVLESLGRTDAPSVRTPRLRVAGTPELVTDDDHPDFHVLPRHRGR
ncbi:hypothetical protein [Nakamurella deserti]|uniref:hypothetical protein n=1 Tax=Nakamurella deserti TaxID=2164074 RepID=UPI000DBE20F6|nr:hypothetical protein [Nakamurella deserti]